LEEEKKYLKKGSVPIIFKSGLIEFKRVQP